MRGLNQFFFSRLGNKTSITIRRQFEVGKLYGTLKYHILRRGPGDRVLGEKENADAAGFRWWFYVLFIRAAAAVTPGGKLPTAGIISSFSGPFLSDDGGSDALSLSGMNFRLNVMDWWHSGEIYSADKVLLVVCLGSWKRITAKIARFAVEKREKTNFC